jgi:DNA-binding response OmpR family regulator
MKANPKVDFNILVFDSNPAVANYVAGLLHLYGFHALPVSKLLDVRVHLLRFNFGLILMGTVNQGKDNVDFERKMRELLPRRQELCS